MTKARLLIVATLFFLPTLLFADSTDPQMDPNDCTGSLSLSAFNGSFALFTQTQSITQVLLPLDPTNLSNPQPSSCVANNTGATITGLMVTTPQIAGDTFTCPSNPAVTCGVTTNNGVVTYDFTGLNILAGNEFGIIESGFAGGGQFQFTNLAGGTATFNFISPEPGTLTLLSALPVWVFWRIRKKK